MELNKKIKRLIRERGFTRLTEPQEKAIPHILNGKNTLIIAPTGSGKTEAAFIPIFNLMLENKGRPVRTIYITPLKSLNRDLIDRLMWWASRLDISIVVRHGDTPKRERRLHTINPPDIMITTPETFSYLLNTKVFSNYLHNVEWIVIDEIHELIPSKRGVQLSINLERIRKLNPNIQVIGLSATIGNPEVALKYITGVNGEGVIIQTDIIKKMKVKITHPKPKSSDFEDATRLYTYPDVVARVKRLRDVIKRYKKVLIFTNTRPMAEILGNRLLIYDEQLKAAVHHSSIGTPYRLRVEEKFKSGELNSIVATSSLELGIDIGDIEYVVQYGSPRQASKLIQRIGRSGHWIEVESRGEVITLDSLDLIESMAIWKEAITGEIEYLYPLPKPYDVLVHEIAGILIKHGKIGIYELYNILSNSIYYSELSIDELSRLINFISNHLGLFRIRNETIYIGNIKRLYSYYFTNLSMIPEIKQYPVIDDTSGKIIGVLDDEFIALKGEEGVKIILAGKPWRIIQLYNEKVYVKPEEDPIGAVPDWIGEEIPVPHRVSRHMGRILREFEERYKKYRSFEDVCIDIAREYGVDIDTLYHGLKIFRDEIDRGYEIPTDKKIVIEKLRYTYIINIFGGTNVNRTIELYLTGYLSEVYGIDARHISDQNRIVLESPLIDIEVIKEALTKPRSFREIVLRNIHLSNIFRWRFLNAAKRMGFISKDAELTGKILDTMIENMKGTPLYEEALQETLVKDYELDESYRLLKDVEEGLIKIIFYDGYSSKMTEEYFRYRELPINTGMENRYQMLEILATKIKILTTYYTVACLDCFNYIDEIRLIDVKEGFKCPICGSYKLGFTTKSIRDVISSLDRYNIQGRLDSTLRELRSRADLYSKYGIPGIFASSFEGLNKKDIENALQMENKIGDRLTKILLDLRREKQLQRLLKKR